MDEEYQTHSPRSTEFMNMEGLNPTIQRKKNPEEDSVFKTALAKMHGTDPANIQESIEGNYKYYKINGHVIFRDINNA